MEKQIDYSISCPINEKCARIRGSLIAQFDENLAKHYFIYGTRGKPKKIDLPRDLVTWE